MEDEVDTEDKFFTDLVKQTTTVAVHRNLSGRYPNANRAMRTIEKGLDMVQDLGSRASTNTMLIPGGGSISVPKSTEQAAAPAPAPLDVDALATAITTALADKIDSLTPPK